MLWKSHSISSLSTFYHGHVSFSGLQPRVSDASLVNNHDLDESHDIIMPQNKKAQGGLTSSAMKAEDNNPQSCADFRRKWTPTEFCKLPSSERTAILVGLLISTDSIFIVQVDGGYNFATEYTPIHEAMPLLYDFSTNKQIAREACEVFYQVGSFPSGFSIDGTLTNRVAEQHVHSILSLASTHGNGSNKHVDNA